MRMATFQAAHTTCPIFEHPLGVERQELTPHRGESELLARGLPQPRPADRKLIAPLRRGWECRKTAMRRKSDPRYAQGRPFRGGPLPDHGADERTRTFTGVTPQRPQRCASTNSSTSACSGRWRVFSEAARGRKGGIFCPLSVSAPPGPRPRAPFDQSPAQLPSSISGRRAAADIAAPAVSPPAA